jgi:uncharacterized membrane-anchored protein
LKIVVSLFQNRTLRQICWFCLACLWAVGWPAWAQQSALDVYWYKGPQTIEVGEQLATLDLPSECLFAKAKDAQTILHYIGNPVNDRDIGLVMSADEQETWMVVYSYDRIGYVSNADLQTLEAAVNPTTLLSQIQSATAQDNQFRKNQGISPLTVTGWYQPPRYDGLKHQLSWAVTAQDQTGSLINYNIRKFGRQGVTAINLVADQSDLLALQPTLNQLADGYHYQPGQRYTDFVVGQDRVANLDLATLIVGAAETSHSSIALTNPQNRLLMVGLWVCLWLAGLGVSLRLGWTRYQAYCQAKAAANSFAALSMVESVQENENLRSPREESSPTPKESRQTRHPDNEGPTLA